MHTTRAALAALAVAAVVAGCSGGSGGIVGCTDSTVCAIAAGGQCLPAPVGFDVCAYPAAECSSGLAWSPEAGSLAGECVALDIDARTDATDASIDGGTDASNTGCPARIAFSDGAASARDIYSANPDGTGITNLSMNDSNDSSPNWSKVGDLVAFESDRTGNAEIFTVAAGGSVARNVTLNPAEDRRPVFSPDGTKIAFSRKVGTAAPTLWVVNTDGTNARELSTLSSPSTNPITWSPDGTRIAFVSNGVVHAVALTGGATNLCTWTSGVCSSPAWSPDGTRVALVLYADSNSEIYTVNADGSNPTNITSAPTSNEVGPAWSPNGTAVAFSSNKNGPSEIFRTAFPVAGAAVRLTMHDTTISDVGPVWSPDGSRLAFVRRQPGGARISTMHADGTNYNDFSVNVNPIDPSWSPCQ